MNWNDLENEMIVWCTERKCLYIVYPDSWMSLPHHGEVCAQMHGVKDAPYTTLDITKLTLPQPTKVEEDE